MNFFKLTKKNYNISNFFIRNIKKLEIQVTLSLILAILFWYFLPEQTIHIFWIWELFMRLLKVFLAPLLFFSIIVAILWLWDFQKLWSLWIRTFVYYIITTFCAILVSIIMMNIFTPWIGINKNNLWISENFNSAQVEQLNFWNFLKWLIPDNIITAFVELNAMQIVTVAIILAIAILATKNKEIKEIKNLSWVILEWILKFISFVIKLTPFWIFAIVSNVVAENWVDVMINLVPFIIVILTSLFIHSFISLPALWYFIWKFNPYIYFMKVKEAILVWFSTASSSATMWLSMSVAKEKAMLNEEVVNFTFPIWTTVNMDWTALYQAWVAIFVAQVLWVDLSIISQLIIVIIVILASIWAAWIPWAWILILTTVFLSIWLPVEAILIIMSIDRILDMFRTWVNVWWDLLTAKVIDNYYIENLKKESLLNKIK